MTTHDALGERMKQNYELRSRVYLPRRTNTIIRLDGKSFHTYTRGLQRPYDEQLMEDMAETSRFLCQEITGTRLAYTQSDEISLWITDYDTPKTQAWFDGNVQKMVSIAASCATAKFNALRPGKLAYFDARVFVIPDSVEVNNYFVWRQKDATRNSIAMAAQSKFSPRQLHGKSIQEMQEMLWQEHGINWDSYDLRFKRGTVVYRSTTTESVTYVDKRTGQECHTDAVTRRKWKIAPAPRFTADDLGVDSGDSVPL